MKNGRRQQTNICQERMSLSSERNRILKTKENTNFRIGGMPMKSADNDHVHPLILFTLHGLDLQAFNNLN